MNSFGANDTDCRLSVNHRNAYLTVYSEDSAKLNSKSSESGFMMPI